MASYLTSVQGISSANNCQLKSAAHGIYQDGPITHTLDSGFANSEVTAWDNGLPEHYLANNVMLTGR